MSIDYMVQVLSDVPGLWDVETDVLRRLAGHFELLDFAPQKYVCRENEPAETLYLLAEGECEVIKTSNERRLFTVATLTPGCLFGHVGLMTLSHRTASVRARDAVKVMAMEASVARELLRNGAFAVTSPFRRALIVALSRQVYSANETTIQLAVEAGVTRPASATELPGDAEERLLSAAAQV